MIDNIKKGDTIEFYTCCNSDRQLLRGTVEYKKQLGLITVVNGNQYELRKLIDIKTV